MSHDRYVKEAKLRLKHLSGEIEDFRAQLARTRSYGNEIDHTSLSEARGRAEELLNRLRTSGEEQWTELQKGFEVTVRELASFTERARQNIDRLLAQEDQGRARFYLGPDKDSGWVLKKEGAPRATKNFSTKQSALSFSRAYARKRRPSELVVRRRDGTFESRHRYG